MSRAKRIELRTVSVKRIRGGDLPVRRNAEIDLTQACRELKAKFDVRYDPIITRVPGMYIKIGEIGFWVFKNGKVTVMGKATLSRQEAIINKFWVGQLRHFVK